MKKQTTKRINMFFAIIFVIYLISFKYIVRADDINNLEEHNNFIISNIDEIMYIAQQTEELKTDMTIGIGLKNNDLVHYPIYTNSKLIGYVTVYMDENSDFNWSLNGLISDIMLRDMQKNPVYEYEYYSYLKIINHSKSLKYLHENNIVISKVVDNKQRILSPNSVPFSANTRIISLRIVETQGSNPWCAAYATSAIINTKDTTSTTNAFAVMRHFYSQSEIPYLDQFALSDTQVYEYSRYKGYRTTLTATLSFTQVRSQISNNSPIYISGSRYTDGQVKGRHAFVISGYDVGANKIYAWNPWGQYVWFSASTKSIPAGSYTYIWNRSVTGWSK